MKKTVKTEIRNLTQAQYNHLRELCRASKNLYNQALYTVRQAYISSGEHLNYNTVDRIMKETRNLEGGINYRMLKAGVSQQILRKLDKNYVSFFRLLKACPDMKPRPPKYIRSDFYNLIYDSDPLPEKYEPDRKHEFSGRRIKRGLYKTAKGILINADLNGALNIVRKAVPEFDFQKLKDGIEGLFNPHCRLLTC